MKSTKTRICESAIELFAEMGFTNAKVDMIAERAGLGVGTIYNYFDGKEDILKSVFSGHHEKRIKYLLEIKDTDMSAIDKIQNFFKYHLDLFDNNRDIGKIIIQESIIISKESEPKKELYNIRTILKEILRAGIEAGQVRQCNPNILIDIISGAVEALAFSPYFSGSLDDYNKLKAEFLYMVKATLQKDKGE